MFYDKDAQTSNNLGMSWFRQGCHRALDAAEW